MRRWWWRLRANLHQRLHVALIVWIGRGVDIIIAVSDSERREIEALMRGWRPWHGARR